MARLSVGREALKGMTPMANVTIEDLGPCRKRVLVEVEGAEVDAARARLVDQYRRTAKVPGFRPGRAPLELVERRYAAALAQDWKDALAREAYAAMKQKDLAILTVLNLDLPDPKAGAPVTAVFTLDVQPSFEVPAYRGLKYRDEFKPVTDADVDEAVQHLRKSAAQHEPVEGRPVAEGDLVQVDFEAALDGQPLETAVPEAKGLGKGQGFWLQVEADAFLGALGQGLKGAAIGEARTVDVPFGETFSLEPLRGRTGQFTATVRALRQTVLPEMNDAFFARFGVTDEAAMRAQVRESIETSRRRQEEDRRRQELARQLVEAAPMELPESVLESHTQRAVYQTVRQSTARGMPQDEIVKHKDRIFNAAREQSAGSLKLRYILHKIADAEKIEVTGEELAEAVRGLAARAQMPFEKMLKKMEGGELENLLQDLRVDKAMAVVVDAAEPAV
jgi:trigger factor